MLSYSDGRPFTQGACPCTIGPMSGFGASSRIALAVLIEGIETEAVLDTGGAYLVLSSQIGALLRSWLAEPLDLKEVNIRGQTIPGTLHRVDLTLVSSKEHGQNLIVEATAFLPSPGSSYDLPPMLGLTGCLERLRFAVDPSDDTFHFGAV
jgi:hypothetical protein